MGEVYIAPQKRAQQLSFPTSLSKVITVNLTPSKRVQHG